MPNKVKNLRSLRSLGRAFLAIILASVMYLFSPYAEEARLSSQVPKELGIRFSESIKLLHNTNYGGLEEGGEIALIKLGLLDCHAVYSVIEKSEHRAKDKIYPNTDLDKFLAKNGKRLNKPITSYKINKKGNTLFYAIDQSQCILARDAYFE